jgi:hypothetical protein
MTARNARTSSSHVHEPSAVAPRRPFSINGALGASIIALVLMAAFTFTALSTVFLSAFTGGIGETEPGQEMTRLVAQHKEAMQTFQDRFNGRSVFFKPPAPAPPPKEPARTVTAAPPPPPPPPPKVDKYTGPTILFATSDMVYFKPATTGGEQLQVPLGEEVSGVRVISTDKLPYSVTLGYQGGEFDVPLWEAGLQMAFLAPQAKPVGVVTGLIEVPPARPDIPALKASAPAEGETATATPPVDAASADRTDRGNRGATRGPRGNRAAGARPTAQPPPDRSAGRTAGAEKPDAEPSDPVAENRNDQSGRGAARSARPRDRRPPPPPPPDEEEVAEEDEEEEPAPPPAH